MGDVNAERAEVSWMERMCQLVFFSRAGPRRSCARWPGGGNIQKTVMEINMLDFNDIPKEQPQGALRDEVKQALLSRLDSVLERILPGGRVHGQRFVVGNIQGDPGESLSVTLDGESAGLWLDFATGEGGDIFDLVARPMASTQK
jgi:hypothetical protein